mgnify:CR=1 FL=1
MPAIIDAASNSSCSAQEPAGEFRDLVEVTEGLLDVVVLDRDGSPVRGLGPEDFRVEVTGNRARILYDENHFLDLVREDGEWVVVDMD